MFSMEDSCAFTYPGIIRKTRYQCKQPGCFLPGEGKLSGMVSPVSSRLVQYAGYAYKRGAQLVRHGHDNIRRQGRETQMQTITAAWECHLGWLQGTFCLTTFVALKAGEYTC
jgi:hypothetical protein